MRTWLAIDVSYMCHRAFHTAGDLSWKGRPTGVIFQFLKSITALKDQFQTDRVAFCFEHPQLYRRDIFPDYKKKRHVERPEHEVEALKGLHFQISELRQKYLPMIGFRNVFSFQGMESDDTLAAIARNADPKTDEVILVTADSDLFQCLDDNVFIYSPQKQKLLTQEWIHKTYGIWPHKWAKLRAIAGCHSDEVPGIKGIGDTTALRYLRGELKESSKAYQAIRSAKGCAIVLRNRRLVELPYEGCPIPRLQEDEISVTGWKKVCSLLGMKSIASSPPISTRKRVRSE